MYYQIKNNGVDLQEFINAQKITARDNARTPMQWNSSTHADFTTGTPWLPVNKNQSFINVEISEKNPNSKLNYFRKLIKLRKSSPALVYGKYTLLDKDNPDVFAYTREYDEEKYLVLLSFCNEGGKFRLPEGMKIGEDLINNYEKNIPESNAVISLQPWQARVIKIK